MAFNFPGMLLNVLIAWIWLQIIFFFGQWRERRKHPERIVPSRSEAAKAEAAARGIIAKEYQELGSMSFHEVTTLVLFVALVALWLSREPQIVPGWADWVKGDGYVDVGDATAAMFIVFLFFVIPAKPNFWCFRESPDSPSKTGGALLNWKVLHDRIPWGVILLLGGGFAVAEAAEESCLSYWLGQQLRSLGSLRPALLVYIVTIFTTALTEVTSNTATATILMPVLAQLASAVKVHPLYLMLPSAVACSYAFMLPVATPPNAIVFEAGRMKTRNMIQTGFAMNVICVSVINLMINTLGDHLFDFSRYPDWAESGSSSVSSSASHCNYTLS
ncbi:unnamed protein product [Darwinula stevensoni]|uniref:Solute carrier family 13 member 5 n=1 Tax=Darwinula stevensoni TaxID=69355 RepID=A0A7R8XHN5_9CRUS|nr:unnamed protein product [Darwinula stevensoni]CAG0892972.1 unnamed protein product [Darwinula stevensoni]